jgi:uncharacterized protein (TIGR02001 family)
MKKHALTLLALAAGVITLPGAAFAEDAPAAPAASPLSFNIGVVSDYRYRGISQSRLKPALQGGADYAASSGLYVGTWASTISWIKDAGSLVSPTVDSGSTPLEIDLYGGYKGDIVKDSISFDIGGLYYLYEGNKYDKTGGANANTFEIYGALTFGVFTAKYSHAVTNLFGFGGTGNPDSKSSGYLDLSATVDLGSGFSLTPHVGHQKVNHYSLATYTDYSLTLGKDLGGGFALSAAAVGTDVKKVNGVSVYPSPAGKDLGKATLVVGAKYTF